jgi:hypothetical protein
MKTVIKETSIRIAKEAKPAIRQIGTNRFDCFAVAALAA